MTDVYISVPTTEKDDDKYERNERARQELLGVYSYLIKFSGADETYSLWKSETRRKWQSFICSPLSIIAIVLFVYAMIRSFFRISNALSWEWGEIFILSFLALLSLTSAVALSSWTRTLLFLDFHDAWKECGKKLGDRVPSDRCRSVLCIICMVLFIGTAVVSHGKYAVQRGHGALDEVKATESLSEESSGYFLDYLCEGDSLIALWGSFLSALALLTYGSLHGIAAATVSDFNRDMQEAADQERLAPSLDALSARHAAVVNLVRILSQRISCYAGFSTVAGVVANFSAMYLSLAYKGEMSGLSHVCVILWTILAIATMYVVLIQPSGLQKLLNEGLEILYRNEGLWKKAHAAPIAQSMVTRVQNSDSKVALLDCLRLSQWSGHALMMFPPVVGGALILIKLYLV